MGLVVKRLLLKHKDLGSDPQPPREGRKHSGASSALAASDAGRMVGAYWTLGPLSKSMEFCINKDLHDLLDIYLLYFIFQNVSFPLDSSSPLLPYV